MSQLFHGDCLEVMKQIPDASIDLVLTDPPYGTTACKWDSVIPFEPMWVELKRIRKESCGVVLFGSEPFSTALRNSNIGNFKYDWIWQKEQATDFQLANIRPLKNYEVISVFEKHSYFPQGLIRVDKEKSAKTDNLGHLAESSKIGHTQVYSNYPNQIVKFNNERGFHPTQKPVDLLEYLIKTYTQEGDTVLDFTMGSGSTGVAAKKLKRNFIGIEKDETYFNIAKKRIENGESCYQADLF